MQQLQALFTEVKYDESPQAKIISTVKIVELINIIPEPLRTDCINNFLKNTFTRDPSLLLNRLFSLGCALHCLKRCDCLLDAKILDMLCKHNTELALLGDEFPKFVDKLQFTSDDLCMNGKKFVEWLLPCRTEMDPFYPFGILRTWTAVSRNGSSIADYTERLAAFTDLYKNYVVGTSDEAKLAFYADGAPALKFAIDFLCKEIKDIEKKFPGFKDVFIGMAREQPGEKIMHLAYRVVQHVNTWPSNVPMPEFQLLVAKSLSSMSRNVGLNNNITGNNFHNTANALLQNRKSAAISFLAGLFVPRAGAKSCVRLLPQNVVKHIVKLGTFPLTPTWHEVHDKMLMFNKSLYDLESAMKFLKASSGIEFQVQNPSYFKTNFNGSGDKTLICNGCTSAYKLAATLKRLEITSKSNPGMAKTPELISNGNSDVYEIKLTEADLAKLTHLAEQDQINSICGKTL